MWQFQPFPELPALKYQKKERKEREREREEEEERKERNEKKEIRRGGNTAFREKGVCVNQTMHVCVWVHGHTCAHREIQDRLDTCSSC